VRDLIRRRRDRRFEVEIGDMDVAGASDDEAWAVRDVLERGFRRLGPDQRTVIVLHYYLGLPVHEVAATLGVPLGTAKARLHRSIKEMRAALEAESRTAATIGGEA
jgi:RNA polymerase sigma factor (sigma-70 family)